VDSTDCEGVVARQQLVDEKTRRREVLRRKRVQKRANERRRSAGLDIRFSADFLTVKGNELRPKREKSLRERSVRMGRVLRRKQTSLKRAIHERRSGSEFCGEKA
jgi:hypothetical protein